VVSSDDRKYIPLLISGVWQSQRVPFTYRLASTKFQAEKWFTLGEVESAASRQFCTPNALRFSVTFSPVRKSASGLVRFTRQP